MRAKSPVNNGNKWNAPARQKIEAVGIEAICERIANSESLRSIAESIGVSQGSVIVWLAEFPEQYARAREFQADALADEIMAIADESAMDTYVDENGNTRTNQEVVARSRLRVDSRKWIASKFKPKMYGEKLNLDGEFKVQNLTEEQILSRLSALSDKLGLSLNLESLKKTGGDTEEEGLGH